ncbi:MAG: hypothetical protein IJZ96_06565 [Lachnospiraceae bacterium]|nr:hypothetical protein [Lachnospiraceae bacterium]
MKEKKKRSFGQNLLGIIFASMPIVIWVIITAIATYCFIQYKEPVAVYVDMLRYGWTVDVLFVFAVIAVWIFISNYKFNLISAIAVPWLAVQNLEVYFMAEFTDRYLFWLCMIVLCIAVMLGTECISSIVLKYYKLQDFFMSEKESFFMDIDDLFDDEEDEEEEDDDTHKEIIKHINISTEYWLTYPYEVRKVLKKFCDDKRVLSDEEQKKWDARIAEIASTINERASNGTSKDYIYTYFYLTFFCDGKFKDYFSEEKAVEYMKTLAVYALFDTKEFNSMLEEAIETYPVEKQADIILNTYEIISPLLDVAEIMMEKKKIQEEFDKRLQARREKKNSSETDESGTEATDEEDI